MRALTPVYTAALFPSLHRELLALLRGLAAEDWSRPTVAGSWRVRDVAAHLLDVDLRKLSAVRDGHLPAPAGPIGSSADLVRFGRDYTERWHHQMQTRDAVGAPLLLERRWLHPLLELSLRALPHAYRGVAAPTGTTLTLNVTGEAGGSWSLMREDDAWRLLEGAAPAATTSVTLDPDAAWRLLYNALPAAEARERVRLDGDASLAEPLFATRSVMV
jgi:hypothetical protein